MVSRSGDIRGRILDIIKLPLIYAFVLGLFFKGRNISAYFLFPIKLLGLPTIPLMLFLLGTDITRIRLQRTYMKRIFFGLSIRMVGGLLLGLLLVFIFNIAGNLKGVIILLSSMPPAVMSYLLAKKFDANPEYAASMVLVGTTLCPLFVLVIYIVNV